MAIFKAGVTFSKAHHFGAPLGFSGGVNSPCKDDSQTWITTGHLGRVSWTAASVSIGSGLARPELFISSLSCQVKRVSPVIYKRYNKDLAEMSMWDLTNGLSLVDGAIADYVSLCRKTGCLESYNEAVSCASLVWTSSTSVWTSNSKFYFGESHSPQTRQILGFARP